MIHRRVTKGGFTLLELIISIALLVLVAVLLARILNHSTKAVKHGANHFMLDETARQLLDFLEQDIVHALVWTNTAFRLSSNPKETALYFVSSAIRKQSSKFLRDTAPMRIRCVQSASGWNYRIEMEYADFSSNPSSEKSVRNLIGHSDYYLTSTNRKADDFGSAADAVSSVNLTPSAADAGEYAVITFLRIKINGDVQWNGNGSGSLPDPSDMPRYVDVLFGVAPSSALRLALRKNSRKHLEKQERIYARRILLHNIGIAPLDF